MSINLKPVSTIMMDLGIEEGGLAHNYFASRCKDRMEKYVPMDDKGTLRKEAYVRSGDCSVVYDQAYAGYQYYGQRKDGSRKVKNYTTPGTGPYWDKKMMSIERQNLLQDMKDYFKGR